MTPTVDFPRTRSRVALATVLLCLAGTACAHPAVMPDPTLAAADSARAVAAADSARVADSMRVVDSIAAHGEVAMEAPARVMHFESEADSLDYETHRRLAEQAKEYRIVVSLFDRHLWVLNGDDTLRSAPAAVAMDSTLVLCAVTSGSSTRLAASESFVASRKIRSGFRPTGTTPRWRRRITSRSPSCPSRAPSRSRTVASFRCAIGEVGVIVPDSGWVALPLDEEVVFDDTLYMPPLGTKNRRIYGELGSYRLDLGDGYLIHGTPEESTVGDAVTHGCVRLKEEDISWLYANVPNGTSVYIY